MNTDTNSVTDSQIIVGIGASAGGLKALTTFFENVPDDSTHSYVIVQHLSPDHKSLIDELLKKHTNLPILKISSDTIIEPGKIYLIPPKNNLIIENGALQLLDKPKGKTLNLPIDLFFESMGAHYSDNCVGVILSGTGSDGSRGIRSLKESGGVVIVQQPDQAGFDGMPQSAIDTGIVDFILPVEEMSTEINTFFRTSKIYRADDERVDEVMLKKILDLINKNTKLDFNFYKKPTLLRRLERRLRIVKAKSLSEYHTYLKSNPEEVEILQKEFLIGVTKFFRDTAVWDTLETVVIPKLVQSKDNDDTIKVWEVGCSTGEETYSLAMLLLAEIRKQKKEIAIKVFATDISQHHLDIAKAGIYEEGIAVDVNKDRLSKYFTTGDGFFKVKENIRKSAIFSKHNVIKDPPFKNMDLVMCRNLLIYLQADVQQNIIKVLHYATRVDGHLVLGSSESLGAEATWFETISRKGKIYRNLQTTPGLRSEVLKSTIDKLQPTLQKRKTTTVDEQDVTLNISNIKLQIGNTILQQYGASSVVVDEEYNIVEAMGNFKKYAQLPEEGFSTNLLSMVPTSIKTAITTSVRRALKLNDSVTYTDVVFEKEGGDTLIDVLIQPLALTHENTNRRVVVTFIDAQKGKESHAVVEKASVDKISQDRIIDLEEELLELKGKLKTSISNTETSNEELQATNEELLASNEELQSTNEELQSVNEELHTVNAEHIQKVEDIALLNADLDNLLNSTEIGTVFVDKNLRIRKFTPSIKQHFKLMDQDVGRPISDFVFHYDLKKQTLLSDTQEVIDSAVPIERYIKTLNGKHFLKKITPFYSQKGTINGAVITFTDIETVKKSQEALERSEKRFKLFYEEDPVMHASINPNTGLITACNKTFVKVLKFASKKDVVGKPIFDLYSKKSRLKAASLISQFKRDGKIESQEMTMIDTEGKKIPIILNSEAIYDDAGNIVESRSTLVEIGELKKVQKKLREKKEFLEKANESLEQFVSICSHDLQEPLSTIRFSSDFLIQKFSDQLNDKGVEYLHYIHEASARMAEQIKALLEHSHIGRELEKTSVDTQEIVEIVKYDLRKRIDDCGAVINVGNLPTLNGYKIELQLLFQNLLGNAIKYCKEGVTPDVRISAYEEGKYWVFAITDNGIGIKEEDQGSIFKIFGRVPTQQKYEGTGVGLAHVEKIVKLHEGKIWLDSQYGVGSTFYFKLKA